MGRKNKLIPKWHSLLQAAVLENMPQPNEMDAETADYWLKNKGRLKSILRQALVGLGRINKPEEKHQQVDLKYWENNPGKLNEVYEAVKNR